MATKILLSKGPCKLQSGLSLHLTQFEGLDERNNVGRKRGWCL